MKGILCAAVAAAAILASAGTANAMTRVSFSSGVDYSSGDYGTGSDTEVISVPLSARVTSGDWSVRVSVPYLQISGNANVVDVTDGGGAETGGGTITRSGTERGFGDTTLSVTRSFTNLGGAHSGMYVDVTGRVRLPTGDDGKGLGVGATDYAIAGELGMSHRNHGGYVNVARRFLGDPSGQDRQDGWQTNLGVWIRTGEHTTLGATYFWREASFRGGAQPSEVGAYIAYRFDDKWRVSLNASAGLSDGSPDESVGLRFTYRPTWLARHRG